MFTPDDFAELTKIASGGRVQPHVAEVFPRDECIIVGSEKSVTLPDGTFLDLRPETKPQDEIGTAFAALEGQSRIALGACP